MGSIEDLNVEITLYNNDIKVFRTVVNLLIPEVYNYIQDMFLDPLNEQNMYTKMEIKYGGQVVMVRNVKELGMSIYG